MAQPWKAGLRQLLDAVLGAGKRRLGTGDIEMALRLFELGASYDPEPFSKCAPWARALWALKRIDDCVAQTDYRGVRAQAEAVLSVAESDIDGTFPLSSALEKRLEAALRHALASGAKDDAQALLAWIEARYGNKTGYATWIQEMADLCREDEALAASKPLSEEQRENLRAMLAEAETALDARQPVDAALSCAEVLERARAAQDEELEAEAQALLERAKAAKSIDPSPYGICHYQPEVVAEISNTVVRIEKGMPAYYPWEAAADAEGAFSKGDPDQARQFLDQVKDPETMRQEVTRVLALRQEPAGELPSSAEIDRWEASLGDDLPECYRDEFARKLDRVRVQFAERLAEWSKKLGEELFWETMVDLIQVSLIQRRVHPETAQVAGKSREKVMEAIRRWSRRHKRRR